MLKQLGNCSIIIGSQWGDEGKGKIIDILAKDYDMVARTAGGANAGHTIEVGDDKFILHLIPSGIIQGKICVIGNGCVVHLPTLLEEMKSLIESGYNFKNKLYISERSHLLFDFHRVIDEILENRKGDRKVGSTKRGVGPAYTSKSDRSGLNIGTLINDFDFFEKRLRMLIEDVEKAYGVDLDTEAELILYASLRNIFKDCVIDTSKFVNDAILNGKNILIEGAQGAMLDIDHGTYPFVTSSYTCTGGSCAGLGVPPNKISSVLAIVKAYTTRVGEGIFPTELVGKEGEILRQVGHEFGATTGRPRRCGWLDMVQLKYSNRINGFTHINITKLDVLSGFKEIKIGVKYKLRGKEIYSIPLCEKDQNELKIEYETFPGWKKDIKNCRKFEDLPKNAQNYLNVIEKMIGVPIICIGVGSNRKELILK